MADCKLSGPSQCVTCGGAYGEHENWCRGEETDRLKEIQERYRETVVYPSRVYEVRANDLAWLIQEVELGRKRLDAASAAPVVDEESIRSLAAERAASAARAFCEELQEDAEGVPQLQLAALNAALDAWEAYPDARDSFDDSQPVLAALAALIEDEHATDHQRRVAHFALTALRAAAAATTAPVEQTATETAEQIVGTVFDNTGASHETLKRIIIERITQYLEEAH